jgi:hypothetical protein
MYLIKGDKYWNDIFTSILSSVNMEKEALLLVLFHYHSLKDIDLKKINTINLLKGPSKDLLTDKYKLIEWFTKIKFHGNLPAIVLPTFDQTNVEEFLKRGTKYKFLKPSDGFAGAGVQVIDSVEEVKQAMEAKESSKKPFSGWVLQDALEEIATFQGYKFHLRVLIVVVVRENSVSVFIANFNIYRLSSDPYNITQLKINESIIHIIIQMQNGIFSQWMHPMVGPLTIVNKQCIECNMILGLFLNKNIHFILIGKLKMDMNYWGQMFYLILNTNRILLKLIRNQAMN